ncbi:MAG: hypothetical protein ACRDIZ_09825 [Actinomycetota bacterium]
MEPAVWALIALLAGTIFGGIFYLGSRLDTVSARIDRVHEGQAELRGEMGELRGEMGELRGEMAGVRGELRRLRELVTDHLERHAT